MVQIYKIPDGKPENQFAFNGEAKNAAYATNIVSETHGFWRSLISKEIESEKISWYVKKLSIFGYVFLLSFAFIHSATTVVTDSPFAISAEAAKQALANSPDGGDAEPITDASKHFFYFF